MKEYKLNELEEYAERYYLENGWPKIGSFDCFVDDFFATNYFEAIYRLYIKKQIEPNSDILKQAVIKRQEMQKPDIRKEIENGKFYSKAKELSDFVKHMERLPDKEEFIFSDGSNALYFVKSIKHPKTYFLKNQDLMPVYELKIKLNNLMKYKKYKQSILELKEFIDKTGRIPSSDEIALSNGLVSRYFMTTLKSKSFAAEFPELADYARQTIPLVFVKSKQIK